MTEQTASSSRLMEFFEDADGRRSMSRLTMFLSLIPSSIVVLIDHHAETLGWYIGGYVLGYVGGKGMDKFKTRGNDGDHIMDNDKLEKSCRTSSDS